jgi:hypothetical protein
VTHSFHLVDMPARVSAGTLVRPPNRTRVDGLQHAECLALMQFGAPIVSLARLQLRRFAMFAQWDDESALDRFLDTHAFGRRLAAGWHVRLQYLRRYGAIAALGDLPERTGTWDPEEPIVAVTIARMKLPELPRFLRWGRRRTTDREPSCGRVLDGGPAAAEYDFDVLDLAHGPRDERDGARPKRRALGPRASGGHGRAAAQGLSSRIHVHALPPAVRAR